MIIFCKKCGGGVFPEFDSFTHKDINVCVNCGCEHDRYGNIKPLVKPTRKPIDIPMYR